METEPSQESTPRLVPVAFVKFGGNGKVYQYDAGNLALRRGDRVIVQGHRGTSIGTVVMTPASRPEAEVHRSLPRVIRRAGHQELAREESTLLRSQDAQMLCVRRIRERRLPMKLIKTEASYDGSKIQFYFYAEEKVDHRDLVRDLAQVLHTRIEMRRLSPREETRELGGMGPCGRELCCSSWLREFSQVSLKMAKQQGLSLNMTKLAGMCGRLKCCLRYEYQTYIELGRSLPAVGAAVESVKGNGKVVRQNLLKQTVLIRCEGDGKQVEVTLDDLVSRRAD